MMTPPFYASAGIRSHTRNKGFSRDQISDVLAKLPTFSGSTRTSECSRELLDDMKEFGQTLTKAVHRGRGQPSKAGSCLGTAVGLLLSASYASSSLASPHLAMAMSDEWKRTRFADNEKPVDAGGDSLMAQVQLSRQEALKELEVAIEMMRTEIGLSKVSPEGESN